MHGVNNNQWDAIVYGLSDYANGLWTAEYTIHMKMAAEMNAKANKKNMFKI